VAKIVRGLHMSSANKPIRKALIAIFTCSLLMMFVSDVLALPDEDAYQSLQIQRELLDVEQQRLQLEQQRYRQEQQQDLERLKREIANQISKIQDKRSALLGMRQESLENLEKSSSSIEESFKKLQLKSEQLEKDIVVQRKKSKLTHPRAGAASHFTEASQQPFEQRRKDISYIFDRYERSIAEMEESLKRYPTVVPDDFAEPSSVAYEKAILSAVLEQGRMLRLRLIAEYKFTLLTQENDDTLLRATRKTSPKDAVKLEQYMTESTSELVRDFSELADGDAKTYAEWMKSAEQ
jgi:hypothetical protein